MPTRLCSNASCRETARYKGRCARHARGRENQINRVGHAIYRTAKWRRTRRRVLFEDPLCPCGAIATDVHHRVDLADGGDPWARSNLQALCHSCHARITRKEQLA